MNQQAELLFGKEHSLEPNFAAPLPYPKEYNDPNEQELLGVEYAMCQSTAFAPRQFYGQKAEEEQSREEEEEEDCAATAAEEAGGGEDEMADEGVCMTEEDPINLVCQKRHTVLSDRPLPDAPALPSSLPAPKRPQVQYEQPRHVAGKRSGEKRRLNFEEPEPAAGLSKRPIRPMPPSAASCVPPAVSAAPVLLVVPVQPQAPSVRFVGPSCSQVFLPVKPPPAPVVKPVMPNKSQRPCAACHIPQCGGKKKRYTPSKEKTAGSSQKIFTYCPTTAKSTTSGFDAVYHSFEHFKSVVDQELEKRKKN